MIHPTAKVDETVRVYGDRSKLNVDRGSRIDAYTVITVGDLGVTIGEGVHIGVGCFISGAHGRVVIGDFCSLSPRATVYTAEDDMSGDHLIGPCAPDKYRRVIRGDVTLHIGSAVGTNGIVFPGVTLGTGAVVGANSFVRGNIPDGFTVVGTNRILKGESLACRRNWKKIEEMADAARE